MLFLLLLLYIYDLKQFYLYGRLTYQEKDYRMENATMVNRLERPTRELTRER